MDDLERNQQLEERRSLRTGEHAAIINRDGRVEVRRVAARNWALILMENGVEYWVGSGNAVNQRLDSRLRGRAIHTTMLYVQLAPEDVWREFARAVQQRVRLSPPEKMS